eukprot:c13909_g1_i1 orf=334-1098(-)
MAISLSTASPFLVGSLSIPCSDFERLIRAVSSPPSTATPPSSSSFPCRASLLSELSFENLHTDLHQAAKHHCSRRFWSVGVALSVAAFTLPAHARDRRNRKEIPIDEYQTNSEGLKYYDYVEGKGVVAEKGQTVLVHFDCMYRGIDAVSSRESKILGGNRIIAQPYGFIVGSVPGKERKREFVENANGLFSAQASPKPPPALYSVTEGMRVGGKRRVVVPPELGFGSKGSNEIPPGATFQMDIELLEIKNSASN